MTESPDCILVWVFLVLTIALVIGGCAGCCVACCVRGASRKRGRDDVEMQWNPREPVARPPPPPKRWSPEERQALCHAFLRLPPPCLPEARAIVGDDEPTVDFASLDVSVCDRLQQYVDAHPSRDSLAGLSGLAFMCVGPAFYGFWFFAIRCAFSTI